MGVYVLYFVCVREYGGGGGECRRRTESPGRLCLGDYQQDEVEKGSYFQGSLIAAFSVFVPASV